MSHSFEDKTYSHLTYCRVCTQLLWGVVKQGLECKECHFTCHRKCQASASKCPNVIPSSFLDDNSNKNSRAEQYLRQLKQRTDNESQSSISSTAALKIESTQKESTYQHIRAIATSDKLHNILADAVTDQSEPVNAYLANQPALNPQITTKNFSRFVSRCGPVFAFRDELILLLSWKNKVDTLISMILYICFCLYPKLLLFIPQAILLYFILSSKPKNKSDNLKPKLKEKEDSTIDKQNKNKASKSSSQKQTSEEVKKNIPDSLISFGLAKLFQPASDESPEYLKNLQNIQNTMGEFSDMYDWVMTQSRHCNWSDESETIHILQIIVLFTSFLGLVIYFIPIKLIFLSSGVTMYALNTRFSKYIIRELQPYVVQSSKQNLEILKGKYMILEAKYGCQDDLQEISVYENQRWRLNRGYIHLSFQDERDPWSNFTGTDGTFNIADIAAPKGYQWKDSNEWKVDLGGPWINDYLGIGMISDLKYVLLISVIPNEDGWVYSDQNWVISHPQVTPAECLDEEQNIHAITRRRRWVRECERVLKPV